MTGFPESKGAAARASRRLARRRRNDHLAAGVVRAGGFAIIASVLGLFVFLAWNVMPLFKAARFEATQAIAAPLARPLDVLSDEHRTHVALLGEDGVVRVVRSADDVTVAEAPLFGIPIPLAAGAAIRLGNGFVAAAVDGRFATIAVRFDLKYGENGRIVSAALEPPRIAPIDPDRPNGTNGPNGSDGEATARVTAIAASGSSTSLHLVFARADHSLTVIDRRAETNDFSGETTVDDTRRQLAAPATATLLQQLAIDADGRNVYALSADGQLVWWDLAEAAGAAPRSCEVGAAATALTLLLGDESVVVGQADGTLSVFFRVNEAGRPRRLERVRTVTKMTSAVRHLAPSWRDRTFLAADEKGDLALCYSTSNRVLWSGASPLAETTALALTPKMNGALLAGGGKIVGIEIESKHPEAGLSAYFGEVWYEGYPKPEYVWQSSSGSDASEPKLGLVPLLFGTLKATLYSLAFAVPIALVAAMYTAQFMHAKLRRIVKPAVEVMASLPSVVLGFLAGLWLSPRIAQAFLTLPLFVLLAIPALLVAGALGARLPARFRDRFPDGAESIAFVAVLALALLAASSLCRPLEVACFGGDFLHFLRERFGVGYDPKNCVVLGIAMGVAIVPIIFTIAEDAFSNVPRTLLSGSLALGADRWHTVTRIVLPTASPGLFSAVMIGFGRAIGETMIVVMASGNTPILDWSLFNGLRSLSANLSTELPEAAQGSTLYRTLFLAAVLLFLITFAVNTGAELIRQRLRERCARL